MIIIAFLGFATLGITLALLLKKLFSGPDLGWVKTLICITCNVYFSACYLHLINHEQFVYFDGRTYRLDDYPPDRLAFDAISPISRIGLSTKVIIPEYELSEK